MTNFKKQIFSVITAGALVVNTATPALAGTTIQISGNGSGSDSFANVNQSSTTTVTQSNNAVVNNNIDSDANTGNNDANYNTGGDVVVNTGDAKTTTNVTNSLNTNSANVNCCEATGTDVLIEGNGALSDNVVNLNTTRATLLNQANNADVYNDVDSDADTGDNDANLNTGGDVVVSTGNATTSTTVKTMANSNAAVIGNGAGASVTPAASFRIIGNGAGSDNYITANLTKATTLAQANTADIDNDVDSDADTGDNEAEFNTGGDVVVLTGNAKATSTVDNRVNFNAASVDCGCEFGNVLAKIDGNGASLGHEFGETENVIALNLANARAFAQANAADLDNDVDSDADSGDNEASLNTGEADSDPAVLTGNAVDETTVNNSGNSNVLGGTLPLNWPFGNTNVSASFNWAAVMAFFGMSM